MKNISKITTPILWILFAAAVVLTVVIMFGGDVEGATLQTPIYLDSILFYTYGVLILCTALTLILEIINIISNPVKSKKSIYSFILIAEIIGLSYLVADWYILTIPGYEGTDNSPSMLKLTDTGLYTFYILGIVAVVLIIGLEIRNSLIKNK